VLQVGYRNPRQSAPPLHPDPQPRGAASRAASHRPVSSARKSAADPRSAGRLGRHHQCAAPSPGAAEVPADPQAESGNALGDRLHRGGQAIRGELDIAPAASSRSFCKCGVPDIEYLRAQLALLSGSRASRFPRFSRPIKRRPSAPSRCWNPGDPGAHGRLIDPAADSPACRSGRVKAEADLNKMAGQIEQRRIRQECAARSSPRIS